MMFESSDDLAAAALPTRATVRHDERVDASDRQCQAPIRVLQFICPTGYYGAERWITALANNADPGRVHHMLAVTDEPGSAELELVIAFRALGLSVHELPLGHRFDPRAITRLSSLLGRERIEVLHTHGYKSDLIGVAAARLAGVPSVCTPHGFENSSDLKLRAFVGLGKRSFRFFDRVVPLSQPLRQDVIDAGVPERRIRYIANGVDLKAIDVSRTATELPGVMSCEPAADGARPIRMTIGYIGQLIGRKNIGDLLDVFERLAVGHPDARLVLIGDGDERAALQRRVEASPVAGRVEFRGFVADAIPCYAEFDLFVMTSSLEGIPRCLMESMACGVPIAAYDIPGVDQLIEHDRTGLLAPYGDKDSLLAHCRTLLLDREASARIADSARRHVRDRFSAERMAREYADVYAELVIRDE